MAAPPLKLCILSARSLPDTDFGFDSPDAYVRAYVRAGKDMWFGRRTEVCRTHVLDSSPFPNWDRCCTVA